MIINLGDTNVNKYYNQSGFWRDNENSWWLQYKTKESYVYSRRQLLAIFTYSYTKVFTFLIQIKYSDLVSFSSLKFITTSFAPAPWPLVLTGRHLWLHASPLTWMKVHLFLMYISLSHGTNHSTRNKRVIPWFSVYFSLFSIIQRI